VKDILRLSNNRIYSKLNNEILGLADRLRENDYKTALLSNNTRENARLMRLEGIDKHFDIFHVSTETGYVKPEPEGFQYLVEALGIGISELVFVDDSPISLSTAREIGFTPILFTSYRDLLKQLTNLGVKIS